VALSVSWGGVASADGIPLTLNHQGFVKVNGIPFQGNGAFRFAVLDITTETNYWTNDGTHLDVPGMPATAVAVSVKDGLYNIVLGGIGMEELPPTLFQQTNLALRIWFDDGLNGIQQLAPDQPITSAAYSFHALRADTASDADTVAGVDAAALEESQEITDKIAVHNAAPDAHPGLPINADQVTSGVLSLARIPHGSGSGLDADTLDGQDAGAFMPAGTDLWVNSGGDTMTGNLLLQGQLGVGVDTPTEAVEVAGTVKATAFTGDGSGLSNVRAVSWYGGSSISDTLWRTGNIGVGVSNPSAPIDLVAEDGNGAGPTSVLELSHFSNAAANDIAARLQMATSISSSSYRDAGYIDAIMTDVAAQNSALSFWTRNAGTMQEALRVDSVGHVTAASFAGDGSGLNNVRAVSWYGGNSVGDTLWRTGNIGIGVSNPSARMDLVAEDANGTGPTSVLELSHFSNAAANNIAARIQMATSISSSSYRDAAYIDAAMTNVASEHSALSFWTRNAGAMSPKVWITNNGAVGIGTSSTSTHMLYVNGTAYSTGGWQSSDGRYKKDLQPIPSPVSKVMKLRGVSFAWKTAEYQEKGFPEGRHYGVIAQEVKEVLPEVVAEEPGGMKAVSYTELVPVLIEAVKEQQSVIEAQRQELAEVRSRMDAIERALQK
jgi:hypothetical protein